MEERRCLAPRRLATILFSSVLAAGLSAGAAATAAPEQQTDELIVLLARSPGAPTPEQIVEGFAPDQPLPGNLAGGSPIRVSYALSDRDRGNALRIAKADPDGLRARLERYVVLTYPPGTDLGPIKRTLAADPQVLHVEENILSRLSVTPSDPLFPPSNPVDPTRYQWGSHTLNFDLAWAWTTGHAYVGLTDVGLQESHPDLSANFRKHFSRDVAYCSVDAAHCDNNVDENYPRDTTWDIYGQNRRTDPGAQYTAFPHVGHGTHTSGIVAATSNNGIGVAGSCWNCSLAMAKMVGLVRLPVCCGAAPQYAPEYAPQSFIGSAITWLVDRGVQVLSYSGGFANTDFQGNGGCGDQRSGLGNYGFICTAIAYMDSRDVTMFASSGNFETDLEFPASDSRVISVGGIDSTSSFWQPSYPGGCPQSVFGDCGSNYTVNLRSGQQPGKQMLVAPAVSVVSTFYQGGQWIPPNLGNPNPCYDSLGGGYGICTGTSMSSPYAAAVGALVRSVNPLLSKANVADILTKTASNQATWNPQTGYGIPNANAAVQTALGTVAGRVLVNRLTPLFSLYSDIATDSFYTTVPQMAAAALYDAIAPYHTVGPAVPMYPSFPGVQCVVSPCLPGPTVPGASVYIFTTENAPYPGAPPLVPLYRLSYNYLSLTTPSTSHRDTTYTTTSAGLAAFEGVGYKLDGIEGYIYSVCTPEPQCIPNGAVRLYRLYNPNLDDWAIFPESELPQKQAAGYQHESCCNDVIGYVYPNVDTDGDGLIDGFELLIGTNPRVADSDCDGVSDGVEVLSYPYDDPLGPGCGGPPVANFIFTCSGLTCSFDASSTASTAGITGYSWNFGDATTGSGVSLNHSFAAGGSYSVTLTVTDKILRQSSLMKVLVVTSAPVLAAESYFALPPCRVLDTRNPPFSALNDGQLSTFQVTGLCGIPSTAKAVSLTVTAVSPTGSGYMDVYPGDQPVGYVTTIDFSPARSPRATNTIVQLAANGAGTVGVQTGVSASPGQVHLILDVDGYFSEDTTPAPGAQGPLGYQTIPPCRIVDTRTTGQPLVSGTASNFTVRGSCGIPAGAVAAALNAAIVAPSNLGFLILWESNQSTPLVSNLNWNAGISALANGARPTLATTTPDLSARFSSVAPGNTAHLVLDTMGYFMSGAPYKFHPIPQCRAVSTTQAGAGAPSLAAGTTRSFQIQGNCGVPVGARAAFISTRVFAGSTTTGGLLLFFPSGGSANGTSSVNFDAGEPVMASGAIVQLSNNNADLSVSSSSNVDLVIKVFGYFQ